jgi:ribosomal protein S18 acetylase RimI-like enzyme
VDYNYENAYEKIERAFKTGGIGTLILRALNLTLRILFRFHRSHWYIRNLAEPIENVAPKVKVSIKYNSIEETLDWEKNCLREGIFTLEDNNEIEVAYKYNHKYFQANYNREIIGFLKVGFIKVYFKEYLKSILIPHNGAFIYDTFVSQNYRGMGVASYMISEVMKKLSKERFQFISCHILPDNYASKKAYGKLGFREIKFVWYFRFFGLRLFSCSPEKLLKR